MMNKPPTDQPSSCGIQTASILLGRSKRTLQRWCEDGTLRVVQCGPGRAQRQHIDLAQILEMFGPCPEPDFAELVVVADEGAADAQNDLGVVLLQEGKAESAVAFFQESARQEYPEAMHWLSQCYMKGLGVERDENLAMMWLNKAAAHGHVIAMAQADAIRAMALQQLQASGPPAPQ
jgi:TPR repeat protein